MADNHVSIALWNRMAQVGGLGNTYPDTAHKVAVGWDSVEINTAHQGVVGCVNTDPNDANQVVGG